MTTGLTMNFTKTEYSSVEINSMDDLDIKFRSLKCYQEYTYLGIVKKNGTVVNSDTDIRANVNKGRVTIRCIISVL